MAKEPASADTKAASTPATTTGDTVVVGCKLPHGLMITLTKLQEDRAPDGTITRRHVEVGDTVLLNGANTSNIIGGFGLTENVPADFFNAWMEQNRAFTPVARGLIFAVGSMEAAKSEAENRAGEMTGLEPLNGDNPGRGLERVPNQPA